MLSWRNWVSVVFFSVVTLSAAPEWQDRYAEVNGVKLHYVEQGQGPLIVFLHGFPEFWYEWKDLLPEFGRDYHAVAPDMRGYNLSEQPKDVQQYRIGVLVEDVRQLAKKLGARRFVLVGHDWGGVVAWAFAAMHPKMLDRLVIINAPHPTVFGRQLQSNPAQQKASSYFNLFTSPSAEATLGAADFLALQTTVLRGWATPEDRKTYIEAWRRGITGGLNYYRASGLRSPVDGVKVEPKGDLARTLKIKVPTLVIWGEKDTALLASNLDGMDRYVKKLRIERIPEASHWVVHEQPAKVTALMRDFLQVKETTQLAANKQK